MNLFSASLLSWLLLPVAAIQAVGVRRRTKRLPPPRGRHSGQIGSGPPAWNILVLGDSSAAGVGAGRVEDTLGPGLARHIHARTGDSVGWRNAGANSAIAAQVRDHVLPHIEERGFTHVVLAVGTNDMKNFRTKSQFKRGFGGLLYATHARWPEATIIWSPIVDMRRVPALPPALAFILSLRARIINATGLALCAERHAIAAEPLPLNGTLGFASDGFHADAPGYAHWADHVGAIILDAPPPPPSSTR
ncbi:SGNH/GDSL hydrolase family protein [Hoeflea marina]|nr:SGNH/GDSL hydrolase family protein [Hoeflea marina]